MNNYYNILPTILIDILIILIFEGLLFFLYLEKQQENIISNQLNNFFEKINKNKQQTTDNTTPDTTIFSKVSIIIKPFIELAMANEKQYNEKQYKKGLLIYIFTLIGIIVSLIIYSYIVIKKFGKTIDWLIVVLTVIITIGLIIVLELLYVKYVLFKKKFNESQIKLDFINAIRN
jgi:uncharacterized protein YacL